MSTTSPPTRASPFKREPLTATVWGHELRSGLAAPASSPAATSTSAPQSSSGRPSRRAAATASSTSAAGTAFAARPRRRVPDATVWAVDVNERALLLTRDNAARLGLTGVRAATPDEVPDDVTFDEIWSNPPVRIGKQALHELLLALAPAAPPGRPGRPRGRQEPRRRLPAALAGRRGLADDAACEREGFPGAGGPSGHGAS